jgi:predicted permease
MLKRLLLRLYPAEFRDRFGDQWSADFDPHPAAVLDSLAAAGSEHAAILRQDVRYALRSFRRSPLFAAAAIVTIAAGIAANTAMFSLIRAVLLRSAPYPDPDRLTVVSSILRGREQDPSWIPARVFDDLRDGLRSFRSLSALAVPGVTVRIDGLPERHFGAQARGPFFDQLGATALLGRLPTAADERPGAPPVVVLDYHVWRGRFASRTGVLGETLWIDGRPHQIVGVLDERFRFPLVVNFWIPTARHPADEGLFVVGRLASGVTTAAARAELETRLPPDLRRDRGLIVRSLREMSVAGLRPALLAFQAAAALLLLIAAANVSNLLASRALGRRPEMAVRAAIGASPRRLVRQVATEAMTLAVLGGIVGAFGARWLIDVLVRFLPQRVLLDSWILAAEDIRLDGGVLLFCALLTAAAGLLFGAGPALLSVRGDLRAAIASKRRLHILAAVQTGLATALLAGAVLLAQAVGRLENAPLGFDSRGLVRARIGVAGPRRAQIVHGALDVATRLPGVRSAAMANWLPVGAPAVRVAYEGGEALLRVVTPGYFETLATPVRRGRPISDLDHERARRVAVVSESVARDAWPDRDPLAQSIRLDWNGAQVECAIVGVAADVRFSGPGAPVSPAIYVSALQPPWDRVDLREIALRMAPGYPAPATELRKSLAALAPDLPVYQVGPMDRAVENTMGQTVFSADLLRWLSLVAGALAVLGLYGTISYQVAAQTRDVGLRMALGATRGRVVRRVLGLSLRVTAAGIAAGAVAAVALSRLLATAIPGASDLPLVPIALAGAAFLLAALLAAIPPAVRAAAIDPVAALRQ